MTGKRRHRAAMVTALLTAAAALALATAVVAGPPHAPWAALASAPGHPALVTVLIGWAGWGIAATLVASAVGQAVRAPVEPPRRGARRTMWAALICLCGVLILTVSVIQATVGYRVCCATSSASDQAVSSAP